MLPYRRQASALQPDLASLMGTILQMPPEVQAARFSRDLDRFVIEALRAVKRQGGDHAFNRMARDLVIPIFAVLASRGTAWSNHRGVYLRSRGDNKFQLSTQSQLLTVVE